MAIKLIIVGLIFGLLVNIYGQNYTSEEEKITLKNLTTGLLQTGAELIPSPEESLHTLKNIVFGFPFEIASNGLNFACSVVNARKLVQPTDIPQANNMNLMLLTNCTTNFIKLTEAEKITDLADFDVNKKVVIFSTGLGTNINETDPTSIIARTSIATLMKAFMCRGDTNFIALDPANYIYESLLWSAINSDLIGEYLADAVIQLSQKVPLKNIRLIGHSSGAHIVGSAGKWFHRKRGQMLERITGLDPAKPCFDEGTVLVGLNRGDAKYVDIVHSDPGILGKRVPMGDLDFYPGGLEPLPKGCLTRSCAHNRAWQYFAETVYPGNERNFMAVQCTSLQSVLDNICNGDEFPMGYDVDTNLTGSYFCDINFKSPFGLNDPLQSNVINCGLCKKPLKNSIFNNNEVE